MLTEVRSRMGAIDMGERGWAMDRTQEATFGDLLRRLRKDAELTQEELAERAELSVRGISDLERSARHAPYRTTVLQLADALELPPAERTALLNASRPHSTRDTPLNPSIVAVPPTPLVGREREVADLQRLLREPVPRLITLTGPGGVGKTRLALEVASQLQGQSMDRVHIVSLAPLGDPTLVISTIAQALGLREVPGRSATEGLLAYLRDKSAVLLLDNLEHLLAAAGMIAEVLYACPELRLLATSRAPLHVHGEQEYPVQPLAVPDPLFAPPVQALTQYAAVDLFVQRVMAVRPDFRLSDANAGTVAEICYRLDGLPLAVELAAARIKILSPQALLQRLDRRLQVLTGGPRDLPARLQSMRDAIAWSYDLLDPAEQTLFRRLSAFAGGCTLEAAEAVCRSVGHLEIDALEGLASLVNKSLVTVQKASDEEDYLRFGMLETVREFAHDQLSDSGEAASTYQEHARYFLALAEEAQPQLRGPDPSIWLDRLEQEHDNLRTALQTAQQIDDVELGLRLAASLCPFWLAHGHFKEAQKWLDDFLARATSAGGSLSARARALCAAGDLAIQQQGNDAVLLLARQALDLAQQIGDDACSAIALHQLAGVAMARGDYETAEQLLEESLILCRKANSQPGVGAVLSARAALARFQGDYERAASLYQEGLALSRAIGDFRSAADVLTRLGQLAADQGSPHQALSLYEESLALHRRLADTWGIGDVLYRTGSAAADLGDYDRGASCYAESMEIFRSLGNRYGEAYVLLNQGEMAIRMGDFAGAEVLAAQSLALFSEIGDRRCIAFALLQQADVAREQHDDQRALELYKESLTLNHEINTRPGLVVCLERMASLAGLRGQQEHAARLHGAASALRETLHSVIPPADRVSYDRDLAVLRDQMGAEACAAREAEGRALSLEEAVAYALDENGNVRTPISD